MPVRSFGALPDGTAVDAITIANDELTATILTYGAVVQDIRLAGAPHPLVLGYDTIEVELTYSVEAPGTLKTTITATTDKPTPVNLAQHSYFNLDGTGTIRDHVLTIPAETYLPVDAGKIPTGEFRPVAGTEYDFRAGRRVGDGHDGVVDSYDHNFVVTREKTATPHTLARLASSRSGLALDVTSTEPGVQFYGGQMTKARDPGLNGEIYGANSGLCLEAQLFPDAPNQKDFPDAILRPGETYRQETLFRFSRTG